MGAAAEMAAKLLELKMSRTAREGQMIGDALGAYAKGAGERMDREATFKQRLEELKMQKDAEIEKARVDADLRATEKEKERTFEAGEKAKDREWTGGFKDRELSLEERKAAAFMDTNARRTFLEEQKFRWEQEQVPKQMQHEREMVWNRAFAQYDAESRLLRERYAGERSALYLKLRMERKLSADERKARLEELDQRHQQDIEMEGMKAKARATLEELQRGYAQEITPQVASEFAMMLLDPKYSDNMDPALKEGIGGALRDSFSRRLSQAKTTEEKDKFTEVIGILDRIFAPARGARR